jgi:selT/selW/selH-like putative selenoprotein
LAAEIADNLVVTAELRRGDNGVFDVVADGRLIYSKHREGRFPDPAAIVQSLRKAM